ncbi:membrane protein insertion efficiency factor YidD [Simkania negevensis]|uniref:Putative membrane protein insertion efficiency factor n=1 Tax=Simkania negevensis TaxID=83561 RepID=A0ABS3APF0_9BACT|nr:membrane protein insertion efficiency factor YidD [Simkania negevensis]
MKLLRYSLVALIRFYQLALSPFCGGGCRFYPTCSQYAIEALKIHGVLRGVWMSCVRLCKCFPWHPGGCDFVPPARKCRKNSCHKNRVID